jgi:hypothetical protein
MSNVTPNLKLNKFAGNLGLLDEASRHIANDANLDAIDAAVGAGGGVGSSLIQVATVTLTSAQLLHMVGSPVRILPAPGVGKALFVLAAQLQYIPGSIGYTTPDGSDVFILATPPMIPQFLNQNPWFYVSVVFSGQFDLTSINPGVAQAISIAPALLKSTFENQPAVLTMCQNSAAASGELTSGDGTLVVTVLYAVVSLG